MQQLIQRSKSVIPACDVSDLDKLKALVQATAKVPGIGAYKVGLELALTYGLPAVVGTIREHSSAPIIYDHQKGGTDIPKLGKRFAEVVKAAGVDAVILFPFGGEDTELQWVDECQQRGLVVIVGGHMTQPKFMASEGGFIADGAPKRMYAIAASHGVTDFVLPGNKPELFDKYRQVLNGMLGEGHYVLYAPGFIIQGGNISETGKKAGDRWHAIVGEAIYGVYEAGGYEGMEKAALEYTSQILV